MRSASAVNCTKQTSFDPSDSIPEWLLLKIDEINIGFWRISWDRIQRQALQWIARNISINDGSNVNGVERNRQSLDVTSKIDLQIFRFQFTTY